MRGTIASPSSTASAPPGMKSACRSTAKRTSLSLIMVADGMGTISLERHERAPAMTLECRSDDDRKNERQVQIEKPEHQERGDHIGLRRHRARQDGSADVVGDCIGGERCQRHKGAPDAAAEALERNSVVPRERDKCWQAKSNRSPEATDLTKLKRRQGRRRIGHAAP